MSAPLISVVIPLFNKAPFIARAVSSVLQQTYGGFELLVVDDGSTDGGVAQIERFVEDKRVRILLQTNSGVGAARNRGMRESSGEIIAFLDADDEWLPWHLEDIDRLSVEFPKAGILATAVRERGSQTERSCSFAGSSEGIFIEDFFKKAPRREVWLSSSSCAIRRHVIESVGEFLEGVPLGEDQEYWARISLQYPLAFETRVSAHYHVDIPGSALKAAVSPNWYPPVILTLKEYLYSEKQRPLGDIPAIRRYAAFVLLEHIARLVVAGHLRQARALLQDEIFEHSGSAWRYRKLWLGSHFPVTFTRLYLRWARHRYR